MQIKDILQIAFFSVGILSAITAVIAYINGLGSSIKSNAEAIKGNAEAIKRIEDKIDAFRLEIKNDLKDTNKRIDTLLEHLIGKNLDN